jgi:hypothetical protein
MVVNDPVDGIGYRSGIVTRKGNPLNTFEDPASGPGGGANSIATTAFDLVAISGRFAEIGLLGSPRSTI